MNFTPQMMAVIQAIWTLRTKLGNDNEPGTCALISTHVENVACEILKHQAGKREKQLKVNRQSWYDNNTKMIEWPAIRCAIEGKKPLPGQEEVELEITKLDQVDLAQKIKSEIRKLQIELDKSKAVIAGHDEEIKAFKSKAYSKQYIDFKFKYEYETFKNGFEHAQIELKKEKDHRQSYQQQANTLRKERDELKKKLTTRGSGTSTGVHPIHKGFYPDLTAITRTAPKAMLQDYIMLRDEAWEQMISVIKKKAPGHIFLVFHKFNIDVKGFVGSKLPLVPGTINYVFACYQPFSLRRSKMYEEAASFLTLSPSVVIVEGTAAVQNVVEMDAGKRDISEQLGTHVASLKNGFDYYDFVEEGFEFVQIERLVA